MEILPFLLHVIWVTLIKAKDETLPPIISLTRYNVRHDAVTVSGFSSGASLATQLHLSHSKLFHGVALFSQVFYRCGPSSLVEFGVRCSNLGLGIFPYNFNISVADAQNYERLKLIDPLKNLETQRIWIWTGDLDEYVPSELAMNNVQFYGTFIPNKSLISATLFHAKHLMPTTNYGDSCDQDASRNVYLGNCNYSGVYKALEFLLEDKIDNMLINPFSAENTTTAAENGGLLLAYNQSEFYIGKSNIKKTAAMGEFGFIYLPKQCQSQFSNQPCFLHINFHGCNEWEPQLALQYIRNSGFLPVAESNRIITVFPLSTKTPSNMGGCWDFFSYTGPLFATKEGAQIKVIKRIIDRILGK